MQTTSKVLMVKPARFAFNPQTGGNNAFSRPGRESSASSPPTSPSSGPIR